MASAFRRRMTPAQREALAQRLAAAELELRAAQHAHDGTDRARLRLARARSSYAAADQDVLAALATPSRDASLGDSHQLSATAQQPRRHGT